MFRKFDTYVRKSTKQLRNRLINQSLKICSSINQESLNVQLLKILNDDGQRATWG